jgi:ABC-2 type transport system ATP-binding protein
MTQTDAIRAESLTKRFGDVTAVDGVEFEIEPGTVYGFLGPNGAGKTTTMRMLVGLTAPTEGTSYVDGVPSMERRRIVERIGYAPDTPPLYERLTAREQLTYVAKIRGMEGDAAADRIERLLERFDLLDDANARIGTYSTGMRQKTSLIQTILHEPDVVLLDEPTAGLDPRAAMTVKETITELAAEGTTVFLSTHILPAVDEVADEIGVLYDGQIVAEGTPQSLKETAEAEQQRTLTDAFLDITETRAQEAQ